jgi:hypothetical protein
MVGVLGTQHLGQQAGRPHALVDDLRGHRRLDQGLALRAHVQRFGRKPHRIDADHRSNSRIQAAHSAAAATGHVALTMSMPRRNSMTTSWAGVNAGGVAGDAMTE